MSKNNNDVIGNDNNDNCNNDSSLLHNNDENIIAIRMMMMKHICNNTSFQSNETIREYLWNQWKSLHNHENENENDNDDDDDDDNDITKTKTIIMTKWFNKIYNLYNNNNNNDSSLLQLEQTQEQTQERFYHTPVHLYEMLEYLSILFTTNDTTPTSTTTTTTSSLMTLSKQEYCLLGLSIFFHDVIYNPKSNTNEKDSANLFMSEFCNDYRNNHILLFSSSTTSTTTTTTSTTTSTTSTTSIDSKNPQIQQSKLDELIYYNLVKTFILATEKHQLLVPSSVSVSLSFQEDGTENNVGDHLIYNLDRIMELQKFFLDMDMAVLGKHNLSSSTSTTTNTTTTTTTTTTPAAAAVVATDMNNNNNNHNSTNIDSTNHHPYMAYAAAIRNEYSFVPQDVYCTKRAEILETFLQQERIYYSDFFYNSLESHARQNVQLEIDMLRQGIIPNK